MVSPVAVDLLLRWKPGCRLLLLHFYLVRWRTHAAHYLYDRIMMIGCFLYFILKYLCMLIFIWINFICIKCILNVYLTHYCCGLVQGLIAGDSTSPDKQEISGKEGASVTLRCSYETSFKNVDLYWYRHRSNQAPQFILYIKEQDQRATVSIFLTLVMSPQHPEHRLNSP